MANETIHFFGAFIDVEVIATDYDLTVRKCVNGHAAETPYCARCGQPVSVVSIKQRRYPSDHYKLLDDDLADTLLDTTPRDMYGNGHILLRSNIVDGLTKTEWMEIDKYSIGLPVRSFPTDAEQQGMTAALMAMPAIKALQDHPQVANVTVRCGYVENAEY